MRRRRERQADMNSHLEREALERQKNRDRRRQDDEGRHSRVTFDGYDDDNDDVTLAGFTRQARSVVLW